MKRRILSAALGLALVAGTAGAEPIQTRVAATAVVSNTTLPADTKSVVVINDGASEIYGRIFTSGETPVDASATNPGTAGNPSFELKVGEAISFSYLPGSTDKAGGYYKTLSIICAAAETATVRVESK